jgi:transcriptional regulator
MARHHDDLKKGSAELMVLTAVEDGPRHGYDIARYIDRQSDGRLRFHIASLYPMLYRLERRGWISGRWVEKAGQRRRRYYRLTASGQAVLRAQRSEWRELLAALTKVGRLSEK